MSRKYEKMAAIVLWRKRQLELYREKALRDRCNPFEIPNDVFKSFYRLPKHLVLDLIETLRPDLERKTKRNNALPVPVQVLSSLRLLATGSFQSVVGQVHFHNIHQSSVSRSLHAFTKALCRHVREHVKFPRTTQEMDRVKLEYLRVRNFPGVIGCIDGTHIAIRKPARPEAFNFINRKGRYTMNVQGACGADMEFLDIVARWPGSANDSHIYANSDLHRFLHTPNALPPHTWLLGDSGYPQEFCLMVPLLHPATPQEVNYNRRHKSTRNVVERAFGLLKMRWLCLDTSGGCLWYTPQKVIRMLGACVILHNICIRNRIPHDQALPNVFPPGNDEPNDDFDRRGQACRAALIATRFQNP